MTDIFGDPFNSGNEALYTFETEQAYESLVEKFFLKWRNIERSHTKLEGNRSVDYFEKFNRELLKKTMTLHARRRSYFEENYGQNPIEWLNFLSKNEIDTHQNIKKSHKDVPLTVTFQKLKNRSIRLYRDGTKAIYNEGPYELSRPYLSLLHTYDDFKDLSRISKKNLLNKFFTDVPNNAVLTRCGYAVDIDLLPVTAEQQPNVGNTDCVPGPSTSATIISDTRSGKLPFEAEDFLSPNLICLIMWLEEFLQKPNVSSMSQVVSQKQLPIIHQCEPSKVRAVKNRILFLPPTETNLF